MNSKFSLKLSSRKGRQGGNMQERIVSLGAAIQRLQLADNWIQRLGIVPSLHAEVR